MVMDNSTSLAFVLPQTPTPLSSLDMHNRQTQTYLVAKPHTKRLGRVEMFTKLQYYTLAFNKNAKPLTQFSNIRELLTAFTDAIHAHHEAFELARMLHRDISADNITINKSGRGLLVDWDLYKSAVNQQKGLTERNGTWQFIAYRLVAPRKVDEPMPMHVKDDDLESFWYVLFWVAMRHGEHDQPSSEIKSLMTNVYNNTIHTETGIWCPETKYNRIMNIHTVRKQKFTSLPLQIVLEEYQQIISSRYQLGARDMETFMLWHEEVLKEFPGDTESQICELDKIIQKNRRFPYVRASHLLSLYWKNDWALQLCRDVCATTTEADWEIGGGNKFRPELFISRQSSPNQKKRKSDSQYMPSGIDSDINERLHTKRSRKDPAHP